MWKRFRVYKPHHCPVSWRIHPTHVDLTFNHFWQALPDLHARTMWRDSEMSDSCFLRAVSNAWSGFFLKFFVDIAPHVAELRMKCHSAPSFACWLFHGVHELKSWRRWSGYMRIDRCSRKTQISKSELNGPFKQPLLDVWCYLICLTERLNQALKR